MFRRAAGVSRFLTIVCVVLFATATVTFAAEQVDEKVVADGPAVSTAPEVLVVPDVRGKAYVFAKGMLEDEGFAWRVRGSVAGYAANFVVAQSPKPGTRVFDTGAPRVTLALRATSAYRQLGTPENAAPFAATKIRLVTAPAKPSASRAKPTAKPSAKPSAKPTRRTKPAAPARTTAAPRSRAPKRAPAFVVADTPREPLNEISLPARARALGAWLAKHPTPTDKNVRHFLYQNSWIVTGARFGWWRGAEALEILVDVDRRAERAWGLGGRSRIAAEQALREVRAKSR